jgi:exosortase
MRPPAHREMLVQKIGVFLVGALFFAAYYPTFVRLVGYWAANDMYSYAFMVPLISGLLIWAQKEELTRVPVTSSLVLGTSLTAAGLFLLLVGRITETNLLEEASLVVSIGGLALLLLGRHMFLQLLFPIAYLFAMIPFWESLTSRIHPYFQLYSASFGVTALRLFGIPVYNEGFLIQLPNITLEVAEACSGINYLIAVLCIGIPLTYRYITSWPRRVFIVLMAVVIALLSNGLRVAIVSLLAYYEIRGADGDIHGPFALFRSLLISGIGYVALFALIHLFSDRHESPAPSFARSAETRA